MAVSSVSGLTAELLNSLPQLQKAVLSQNVDSTDYTKLIIRPVSIKGRRLYQLEQYTADKVYHENLSEEELIRTFSARCDGRYRQALIVSGSESCQYIMKKDGSYKRTARAAVTLPAAPQEHNRKKTYILSEGENIPAFVDLGIYTSDFRIVKSKYDKYKQINRFIELIADELSTFKNKDITILDFGCGKSYLTFILYYYFTVKLGLNTRIIGYDLKADVVEHCNQVAQKYGYEGLEFVHADVTKDVLYDRRIDMVVSLHACDVATDYALNYAITKKADYIFSVPCCQHEINAQIRKGGDMDVLLEHGIIRERVSALLTDSIRAGLLEDFGYEVDMIEFIDFDHSPKNIMIRARNHREPRLRNLPRLDALAKSYHFRQTLLELSKSRLEYTESERSNDHV